jgi:hypothetical protein
MLRMFPEQERNISRMQVATGVVVLKQPRCDSKGHYAMCQPLTFLTCAKMRRHASEPIANPWPSPLRCMIDENKDRVVWKLPSVA